MNFSDETVEKVHKALVDAPFAEHRGCAKAALSSLTLADLMQVEEVRALVEATSDAREQLWLLAKNPDTCPWQKQLKKALTQFTEAK